jgi:hypothetical protein
MITEYIITAGMKAQGLSSVVDLIPWQTDDAGNFYAIVILSVAPWFYYIREPALKKM